MPLFENVKFLQPVVVSTFKNGVTIPLEAQTERLKANKRTIVLTRRRNDATEGLKAGV